MEKSVVFVHGHGHSSFCWDNFKNKFDSEKKFNLYFFNYKNHGEKREYVDENYTNDDYAKDLKNFIYNNKINNYIIIGHSNGCSVIHYSITKFMIKPQKVFLLGPLQDNYILNILFNMVCDFNLWEFLITLKFKSKRLVKYALFSENTNNEIIEKCLINTEEINHTKYNYFSLNKNIIENVFAYIILGDNDKLIPYKLGVKSIEIYNNNGIIKTFNIGHNMMMDNGWENVCNYIINNINQN